MDSAYKVLGSAYEKQGLYDEALKTYKQLEILGFTSQELEAKIAQIENIILSDDKFSISENEDKKSSRSIILSHSISYQDKISSKFSKVLDGLCSTETNRVSEEEK